MMKLQESQNWTIESIFSRDTVSGRLYSMYVRRFARIDLSNLDLDSKGQNIIL
jgi:hypothetical protein